MVELIFDLMVIAGGVLLGRWIWRELTEKPYKFVCRHGDFKCATNDKQLTHKLGQDHLWRCHGEGDLEL